MDENMGESDDSRREIDELRRRLSIIKKQRDLLLRKDKVALRFGALMFMGPGLTKSIRRFVENVSSESPFPRSEFADVISALCTRFLRVGVVGFFLANVMLAWQNLLIREQNEYFKEQLQYIREELRQSGEELALSKEEVARSRDLWDAEKYLAYVAFLNSLEVYGPSLVRTRRLYEGGDIPKSTVSSIEEKIMHRYRAIARFGINPIEREAWRIIQKLMHERNPEMLDLTVLKSMVAAEYAEKSFADVGGGDM
jgi:hypothetical protein